MSPARTPTLDLGVHVGWVSHRGSFADCMPLWNERRDICLVFSGEDFMDADEVRQLCGREFDAQTGNASYLIALYEAIGLRFIEKLNGWFSGLLIDLRKNVVVLFNDRYGLGRIYFHEAPDRFYFASEAKALLEILPRLRRLDLRGVAETFSCGSVLQNRTLFDGISLLPGGSRWSFAPNGHISKEKYFESARVGTPTGNGQDRILRSTEIRPSNASPRNTSGGPVQWPCQ